MSWGTKLPIRLAGTEIKDSDGQKQLRLSPQVMLIYPR